MFQLSWQDATAWQRHGGQEVIPPAPVDRCVDRAAVFYWEEHCVECSAPQCYSACQLFVARRDGRCARFFYGIQPNSQVCGLFAYGADITFRRWAKLETKWPARPALKPVPRIRRQGKWVNWIENVTGRLVPLAQRLWPQKRFSGLCTHVRRNVLRRLSADTRPTPRSPDALYLKCFSPDPRTFRIQLELITDAPVFRTSLTIQPGWNEHIIDARELLLASAGNPGRLQLSIEHDLQVRLIFTWLDLVCFSSESQQLPEPHTASRAPAAKIKCVAWDLDNTLWQGVIGDAGPAGVTVDPTMLNMIRRLDERGILQTIVSKNEHTVAWQRIEQLGLADYFLFPAIHWGPKSRSVEQIAGELNINVDTFAVIDDSPFERHEIQSSLPQVRVFDPADGTAILERPEFDVPVTAESRNRRQSYLVEARRRSVSRSWRGDYADFLRSCQIILQIRRPLPADRPRCLELIQRSNQFNLSGQRYTTAQFDQLVDAVSQDSFCFEVRDSFGSYGIVGFASFHKDRLDPLLTEFVLSCRVAQKMVESTFLLWYATLLQQDGSTHLSARLNVTDRNKPLQDVLAGLQFECVAKEENCQQLRLTFPEHIQLPDVITLDDQTAVGIDPAVDSVDCDREGAPNQSKAA